MPIYILERDVSPINQLKICSSFSQLRSDVPSAILQSWMEIQKLVMKRGLYNILIDHMHNFFAHHTLIEGDCSPLPQIHVIEVLGRGNAHVYKAEIKAQSFAIKQIEIKADQQYQNFLKEISHMRELSQASPFLIKYVGYFVTHEQVNQYSKRKYAHIVMQCAEMNLQHFIAHRASQRKGFSNNQILKIQDFLIDAFSDLENKKIAHCDIKPENILVMNAYTLEMKICDVGSCKLIDSQALDEATIQGTVPYLAPQLVRMKQKRTSNNPFRADVYSFGLVLLYLITNKKFNTKERFSIPESVYFQIITEWAREARELTNHDNRVGQVLKISLEFEQKKRAMFSEVKEKYESEKKKKNNTYETKIKKLEMEDAMKAKALQANYKTEIVNQEIVLFQRKKITTKISNKTSIGFTKTNYKSSRGTSPFSPTISPVSSPLTKRKNSDLTSSPISPQKSQDTIMFQEKPIIQITESNRDSIPFDCLTQQDKNFIMHIPWVGFKRADCVSIFKDCCLGVLYELTEVKMNKLFIEYAKFQGIGMDSCVSLMTKKIYANLSESQFVGGYKYLFRSFCSEWLESLEINLNNSDASFEEVLDLVDRLSETNLKSLTLIWQSLLLTLSPDDHFQLTEKLSKLPVRKLVLVMNKNFIKYEKEARWLLPKNCQTLYLQYDSNFLGIILANLALSISKCPLKELYLNLSNNSIPKGEANFIFKAVTSIQCLQKLVLNLSWNPIEDLSYMLQQFQKLKNVTSLQLKLHHCGISQPKLFEIVSQLKYLFDKKLKILKIGYDRTLKKQEYAQKIQDAIEPFKNIKVDVQGIDSLCLMAYIKRKEKSIKTQKNMQISRVKAVGLGLKNVVPKQQKIFKNKNGFCEGFLSSRQTYENYQCLSCSEMCELSKSQYYCKYCIESCGHHSHNFVKIYERKNCECAYSGHCSTYAKLDNCADDFNSRLKQKLECLKCRKCYCLGCGKKCLQLHKEWVEQSKQVQFFCCGSAL